MAIAGKLDELSGFDALTGTPEQVRKRLDHHAAEHVIAFTLKHGSASAVEALAKTFVNIAPLVRAVLERRQQAALNSIVEALVPDVPPPRHMVIEARMTAQARKEALENASWLTASQVAEAAGFSMANPSAQPNKWKKEGRIFAVRHRGVDYFPGYGLDASSSYRPLKGLAKVLAIFEGRKDDWGLAYWFSSANSFLGGKRPQDLLSAEPERVASAAEDELAGVAHG